MLQWLKSFWLPPKRLLDSRIEMWAGRINDKSVTLIVRCQWIFVITYVLALAVVASSFVAALLGIPDFGIFVVLVFLPTAIVLTVTSVKLMNRAVNGIYAQYGLKRPIRPVLSKRVLLSPYAFDSWLLQNRYEQSSAASKSRSETQQDR